MAKRFKKLIGTLPICGIPFKVYLKAPMVNCFGVCHPEHAEIHIRAGMTVEMTRFYLLHESLHAVWMHAGAGHLLNIRNREQREELFMRMMTPHLMALMDALRPESP